ncbi:hypothetical protein [Mesorhizobium sp. DCY119]|uniref:hypothetical protein n=1 Tax=Mesorhizobium sp. DCY119 TaxID=2108445 RepID=UPI000E727F41|nr:hypothetical protein [Mesorhizobium sp. DCY119]RJG44906.1 hypothetical protein D3Y55_11935 [Mesorhizobium sp. DCY119]
MLNKSSEYVIPIDDIEGLINSMNHAVAIAADIAEGRNKDMALYAIYEARKRAEELFSAFYASAEKRLRLATT